MRDSYVVSLDSRRQGTYSDLGLGSTDDRPTVKGHVPADPDMSTCIRNLQTALSPEGRRLIAPDGACAGAKHDFSSAIYFRIRKEANLLRDQGGHQRNRSITNHVPATVRRRSR